jgi:hypothetical protein
MRPFPIILLLLAGCASVNESALWKNHDLGPFALKLPSYLRQTKVQGEDSYVGRFRAPGLTVEFDYGEHSDPLAYEGELGFVRAVRLIDGRHAVVASWTRVDSLPYVTAIHFPSVTTKDSKLTIYILSDKPQAVSEEIFSSVRFRKEEPNKITTDNSGASPLRV